MASQGTLAPALGWFSIALGAVEVVAPKKIAQAIGTQNNSMLVRAYGAREIAAGVSVLSRRNPAQGMWMRVAGDALDVGSLALCLRKEGNDRSRLMRALAIVGLVTATDVYAAITSSRSAKKSPKAPAFVKTVSIMASREELFERLSDPQWLTREVPALKDVSVTVVNTLAPSGLEYRVAGLPGGLTGMLRATLIQEGTRRGTAVRIEALPGTKGAGLSARLVRVFAELPGDAVAFALHRLKNLVEVGEVVSAEGPSGRMKTKRSFWKGTTR